MKFLSEDKEKFNKMMADSQKAAKNTADRVKELGMEKKKLHKDMEDLISKIAQKENQIKKDDDELNGHKSNKHFLDILAIQAGKKKMQKQKKPEPVNPSREVVNTGFTKLLNKTMNK